MIRRSHHSVSYTRNSRYIGYKLHLCHLSPAPKKTTVPPGPPCSHQNHVSVCGGMSQATAGLSPVYSQRPQCNDIAVIMEMSKEHRGFSTRSRVIPFVDSSSDFCESIFPMISSPTQAPIPAGLAYHRSPLLPPPRRLLNQPVTPDPWLLPLLPSPTFPLPL